MIGQNLSPLPLAPRLNDTFHITFLTQGADKTVKAPSGESVVEAAEKEEIKNLLR